MTGFEVETEGFVQTIERLKELERDLSGGGEWIVGTKTNYAIFWNSGRGKCLRSHFSVPQLPR